jgi:hypothetical protein
VNAGNIVDQIINSQESEGTQDNATGSIPSKTFEIQLNPY